MIDPKLTTAIQLLARQDATFAPLRDFGPAGPNFLAARTDFLQAGIPWRSTGGSDTNRKRSSRFLRELSRAGLVRIRRSGRVMTPFVKLTEEAEAQARGLCGLPTLFASWVMLQRVADLAVEAGREWVPEYVLADWPEPRGAESGSAEARELAFLEDLALPGLCRGWLESGATSTRHVAYQVGRLAASLKNDPADVLPEVEPKTEAYELYLQAFQRKRQYLLNTAPADPREIGPIPLSTGILHWPPQEA